MIEQRYQDEAAGMIATSGMGAEKSPEWCEGLHNAIAWHLAGLPQGHGRSACPYEQKTARHDAWEAGWFAGKAACDREGIGG